MWSQFLNWFCYNGFEWPSMLSAHLSGKQWWPESTFALLKTVAGIRSMLWYDCTENCKTPDVQQWEQPRTVDWDDSLPFLKLRRFQMVKMCSSLLRPYAMAHFHQSLWGFCLGKETRERKCQSQVRVAVMAGIFPVRSALQTSGSKSQNSPWTPLLESLLKSGSPQTKWYTSMASQFCLNNPVLFGPPSVLFSCSCSLSQNNILSCSVSCRTAMKTESAKHEYPVSCNGRH